MEIVSNKFLDTVMTRSANKQLADALKIHKIGGKNGKV